MNKKDELNDYFNWALSMYDDWCWENQKPMNQNDLLNFVFLFLMRRFSYEDTIEFVFKKWSGCKIPNFIGYCDKHNGQCSMFCHLFSNQGCKRAEPSAAVYYKEVYLD